MLNLLVAEEQRPVSEVADALGRHPITVEGQCYDIQSDGYIVTASSGRTYELTEKGRARLATDDR